MNTWKQQVLACVDECDLIIQSATKVILPELSAIVIDYVFGPREVIFGMLMINREFGHPRKIMHIHHYIKNVMVNGVLTAMWTHSFRMVERHYIVGEVRNMAYASNMLAYPKTSMKLVEFANKIQNENVRMYYSDANEPILLADEEEIYVDELMEDEMEEYLRVEGEDMSQLSNLMVIR